MVVAERAPDVQAFGLYIRQRRNELGMTQTELGRRAGYVQERISSLEHGKYGLPSLQALVNLAQALETDLFEILTVLGYECGCSRHSARVGLAAGIDSQPTAAGG